MIGSAAGSAAAAPHGEGEPFITGRDGTRAEARSGDTEPEWLAELSARVAGRRKRKSSPQEDAKSLSMEFTFEEPESRATSGTSASQGASRDIDLDLEGAGPREVRPRTVARVIKPAGAIGVRREQPGHEDREQPDVVLGAVRGASAELEPACAPVGRRFWAGVADAGVLLLSAGIFVVVYLVVGGKVSSAPADLPVAVFIACFGIFAYFGIFSAASGSTPGQAAMQLKLRNLDGEAPTLQECLLRAFGYLVSIASLMLGFLWSAMDSDGMAWHDHISGTVLVEDH